MKKLIYSLLLLIGLSATSHAGGIFSGPFDASADQTITGQYTVTGGTTIFTSTVSIQGNLQYAVTEHVIPADAGAPSYTINPSTTTLHLVNCADTDGCSLLISEGTDGSVYQNMIIHIFYKTGGLGILNINDQSGQQDVGGSNAMTGGDNMTLIHMNGIWNKIAEGEN